MRRIMTCGALLALLLVSTTGANSAQKELTGDQKFLKDTFTTSHAAVRLSELADKHSNNAKVKDFAKMVIKDHKEMNDKIAKAAADQKLAVVAGNEQSVKDALDRLSKLNGVDFDREYLKTIINNHEAIVQMLQNESKDGKDANLTSFAKTALPGAEQHLKEARALAKEIK